MEFVYGLWIGAVIGAGIALFAQYGTAKGWFK